jgi:zinc transport system substrate-binding protein
VGHPNFPFERAWLALLLDGRESLPIIDASSRELARGGDPHVWLVASSMRATAERVAQALSALLPASARQIGSRLASLRRRIDALDAELRATFAPHAGRSFYVMHPALGHFARAYGLEQVAIERGHKPPSVHALAELIRRARADDVRVVFSQPQFDPAPAQAFADALGGRVETLDALAYDWDDNLRRIAAALVGEFAR